MQHPSVRQEESGRVIHSSCLVRGEHPPLSGNRAPELSSVHRTGGVAEAGGAGSPSRQNLTVRQKRRVELAARVPHALRVVPAWLGLVEVDQLSGTGGCSVRRIASTQDQDLSRLVHHRRTVVSSPVITARPRNPATSTGWIQIG